MTFPLPLSFSTSPSPDSQNFLTERTSGRGRRTSSLSSWIQNKSLRQQLGLIKMKKFREEAAEVWIT